MNTDLNQFYIKVKPLIGQCSWEVWLGSGSFITLEFGKKIEAGKSPYTYTRGEWCLWVQMSAWRLETKSDIITASEDTREGMSSGIKRLKGMTLCSIKLQPPSLETVLTFEDGFILRLFPIYSGALTFDDWTLFCTDGYVLSVGCGQWRYSPSNEP